ncbi:hypothetical protein GE09DRAFT_1107248 [Coniochaeta sp. 2T2.1]|nr:hypothetical protein GE09DRAFT_1107248 [Coniochaeta sp. 2T2.1]
MRHLQNLELVRVELVQRVQDVGEKPNRVQHDAVVHARRLGPDLGQPHRARGLEERLGRGDDARQQAEEGRRDGLAVLGHAGLAYHGKEGDDVEAPAGGVVLAGWEPLGEGVGGFGRGGGRGGGHGGPRSGRRARRLGVGDGRWSGCVLCRRVVRSSSRR